MLFQYWHREIIEAASRTDNHSWIKCSMKRRLLKSKDKSGVSNSVCLDLEEC